MERFVGALRVVAGRRRRLAIGDCFEALYDADPFAIDAADKRARLAAMLSGCASAGVLAPSKAHDRGRPALPSSVRFTDVEPPRAAHGRDWSWRAELGWAAELQLSAYEFEVLRAMQEFLRTGGASRFLVPHRERSLEILGHEKALDALVGGRLFHRDRLTLELLRCSWAPPPLAFARVGAGHVALVVENAAAYHSCVAAARPDGVIGVVVYGAGQSFVASVAGIRSIPGVTAVRYAGDLDGAGLAMPDAADVTALAHGVPSVRPAARLWTMLLELGRPQPAEPLAADAASELCLWLPEELRERACRLLVEGKRIAQESVGAEMLARDPSWCIE